MNRKTIQLRAPRYVLDSFPERTEQIARLYLFNEKFRGVCDELTLAYESLQHFELHQDGGRSDEIIDYREVIQDLQKEILLILNSD